MFILGKPSVISIFLRFRESLVKTNNSSLPNQLQRAVSLLEVAFHESENLCRLIIFDNRCYDFIIHNIGHSDV